MTLLETKYGGGATARRADAWTKFIQFVLDRLACGWGPGELNLQPTQPSQRRVHSAFANYSQNQDDLGRGIEDKLRKLIGFRMQPKTLRRQNVQRPRMKPMTKEANETSSQESKRDILPNPDEAPPILSLFGISSFLLLITYWFYRHFSLWYSQKVGESGSILSAVFLAVLFVFGLLQSFIGADDARNGVRHLLRRLERSRIGLCTIGALNIFSLLLIPLSNSIYIQFQQDPKSEINHIKMALRENGTLLWQTGSISADEPLAFKFDLNWHLRARRLRSYILQPALYRPMDKALELGGSLRLKVPPPAGFEEYFAVRIVPGHGFYHNLPATQDEPSLYQLHIWVGARANKLINLSQSLIYLGRSNAQELRIEAEKQPSTEWKPNVCRYILEELPGTGECTTHPLMENSRYETLSFGRNDIISTQVSYTSRDGTIHKSWSIERHKVNQTGVMTVYLEPR